MIENTANPYMGLSLEDEIRNGMMLLNVFSMPFRALDGAVGWACNSTSAAQTACQASAEKVQKLLNLIPERVKKSVSEVAERMHRELPAKFERKYGIDPQETTYALESAGYILEGAALAIPGAAAGKVVSSIGKAASQALARAKNLVRDVNLLHSQKSMGYTISAPRSIKLERNGLEVNLDVFWQQNPGHSLALCVIGFYAKNHVNGFYCPTGNSAQSSEFSFSAFKTLKGIAKEQGVKELYLQWIPGNKQLLDIATRSSKLAYMGLYPAPAGRRGGTLPNFRVPISPAKITSLSRLPANRLPGIGTVALPVLPKYKITDITYESILPIGHSDPLLNHPIEEMAQKIVNFAGDLTGIVPAANEVKSIKLLIVNAISDPRGAPRLIVKRLLQEPERIFESVLSAPRQFTTNVEAFMGDASLMSALGIVTSVFTLVSIANEILPVMNKITREAIKNPLKLPIVVPKEVLNLTIAKIKGIWALARGLVTEPGKTGKELVKGVMHMPRDILHNVKNLCGLGNSKKQKKKRKDAERAQLQAAMQQRQQQEQEHQAILKVMPTCYHAAEKQWMVKNGSSCTSYFTDMTEDWKQAVQSKRFSGSFPLFATTITNHLKEERLDQVIALSPKVHAAEPIVPPVVALALAQLMRETIQMAQVNMRLDREVTSFQAAIKQLGDQISSLAVDHREYADANCSFQASHNSFATTHIALTATNQGLTEGNARLGALLQDEGRLQELRRRLAANIQNNN